MPRGGWLSRSKSEKVSASDARDRSDIVARRRGRQLRRQSSLARTLGMFGAACGLSGGSQLALHRQREPRKLGGLGTRQLPARRSGRHLAEEGDQLSARGAVVARV